MWDSAGSRLKIPVNLKHFQQEDDGEKNVPSPRVIMVRRRGSRKITSENGERIKSRAKSDFKADYKCVEEMARGDDLHATKQLTSEEFRLRKANIEATKRALLGISDDDEMPILFNGKPSDVIPYNYGALGNGISNDHSISNSTSSGVSNGTTNDTSNGASNGTTNDTSNGTSDGTGYGTKVGNGYTPYTYAGVDYIRDMGATPKPSSTNGANRDRNPTHNSNLWGMFRVFSSDNMSPSGRTMGTSDAAASTASGSLISSPDHLMSSNSLISAKSSSMSLVNAHSENNVDWSENMVSFQQRVGDTPATWQPKDAFSIQSLTSLSMPDMSSDIDDDYMLIRRTRSTSDALDKEGLAEDGGEGGVIGRFEYSLKRRTIIGSYTSGDQSPDRHTPTNKGAQDDARSSVSTVGAKFSGSCWDSAVDGSMSKSEFLSTTANGGGLNTTNTGPVLQSAALGAPTSGINNGIHTDTPISDKTLEKTNNGGLGGLLRRMSGSFGMRMDARYL